MTRADEQHVAHQTAAESDGMTPLPGEPCPRSGSRRDRAGGRRLVRLIPLVFAVVMAAAVGVGLWQAANPPKGDAPEDIGGYSLTQLVTGPSAVAQMSRLHGRDVGVVDGYVAHYEGPRGGIVAYVANTASAKAAADLLQQMEGRIGAGNQYFTNLKPINVGGVRVISVRSGTESHYFWAAGIKVIWLAFDRDDPAGLGAAIQTIK